MTRAAEERALNAPAARPVTVTPLRHISITNEEFHLLRKLIHARFGIHLADQKKSLVEGRLQSLLRRSGYGSFDEYYRHELTAPTGKALSELVDRISTNFTFFNREPAHFDLLATRVLPEIIAENGRAGSRDLRVWCAAASTGEEPWMLAMIIREALGEDADRWQAGLLATDISERALQIARAGVYDIEKLDKMPAALRKKYFTPRGKDAMEVSSILRKEVVYRRFNLMNSTFPFREPFDVIFCRNVMIYFEAETKEQLIRRIHESLRPGGYLFVGHAESLTRSGLFNYIAPAAYRKSA